MITTSATSQCWKQKEVLVSKKTHITIIKNKLCHQYQLMVLLLPCVANFIPKIIRLGFRVSEVLLGTQRELVWEHIEDNKNLKIQQPQLPKRKK
jgi:hypothetical protein